MKQFINVLKFELSNYFKNKSYLLTTVIISLLLIIGLSIPSFVEIDALKDDKDKVTSEENKEDTINLGILDLNNTIKDKDILDKAFNNVKWKEIDSKEEAEDLVKSEKVEGAFIVDSLTEYTYYVNNSSFSDENEYTFESVLTKLYQEEKIGELGLDYKEINKIYNTPIESNTKILGKDSVSNFAYTYGLIFIIYMMVVFYGQLIAVSVTSEKSNRAIEVLVTSTSSNSLIFGKVIAGAIASILQTTIILGSAILSYTINKSGWNNKLDFIFDIPAEVLLTFAVFGILGFLLYSFIFGVLGALVSKTEDISKSATPITMILVVVFILSMNSLSNPDGIISIVLSYIPFSSCFAMFLRVAMGSVSLFEIVISLLLVIGTTGIVGVIGAKIYRMGTLMIGNPVKLSNALKSLKKNK